MKIEKGIGVLSWFIIILIPLVSYFVASSTERNIIAQERQTILHTRGQRPIQLKFDLVFRTALSLRFDSFPALSDTEVALGQGA